MKLRYSGPPDQQNQAVAEQNPEKGALLQTGHHYEVAGDAAQELLKSEHWTRVTEPKPDKPADPDDKE